MMYNDNLLSMVIFSFPDVLKNAVLQQKSNLSSDINCTTGERITMKSGS